MVKKTKKCILCPYKHIDDCLYNPNFTKCYSLSNIVRSHFPFKQIRDFKTIRSWKKVEKYHQEMDKKYGDGGLENDDTKFIWGIKSWDDLSGHTVDMYTMNTITILYDKKDKMYYLGIETAFIFEDYKHECDYLNRLFDAFTKYMDDNGLDKNTHYELFMNDIGGEMKAETIEELYTKFKIFVKGYERIGE